MNRRHFLGVAMGAAAAATAQPRGLAQADPLGVRHDFPVASDVIYLNSAYIGPVPLPVAEAGRAFAESKARRPISLPDMLAKREEVRGRFARLVGADPEEIGFLFSTSDGENIVTSGLGLQRGDNVVVDDLHYTTSYVLYRELERRTGAELRIAKSRGGAATPDVFEPLVDRRTRLVSVAWVSHQNGYCHDMKALADLAHGRGALLYADAIQAVGMMPIDAHALGVDFFATGTYKWLLAGYGAAPFYIRREHLDRIPPDRAGFLQVEKELPGHRFELFQSAKKYEYATLAFDAIYQLGASLQYLEAVGAERIAAHTFGLAARLRQGLVDRGLDVWTPPANRSSIVVFAGRKDLDTTRRILAESRLEATVRDGGRQIRAGIALFNTGDEVDRLLDAAVKLA